MLRRHFLNTASLATVGLCIPRPFTHLVSGSEVLVGLQLYSVRADMKADPAGTLEKLAQIGYRNIEHANYVNHTFYGYTAKAFRQLLDSLGLSMPSGHTVMTMAAWDASKNEFTSSWKQTVEDAAIAGQQLVISPSMGSKPPADEGGYKQLFELFNKCGELCKQYGMVFGYHNHAFEFNTMVAGMPVYDFMLQHTDSSLVQQQLDIGNMHGGGGKAADYLHRFPGRFRSLHVKDVMPLQQGGFENCLLGKGIIGVKDVLKQAVEYGGSTHLIIEQEQYQELTPIEAMEKDLHIMKDWGF